MFEFFLQSGNLKLLVDRIVFHHLGYLLGALLRDRLFVHLAESILLEQMEVLAASLLVLTKNLLAPNLNMLLLGLLVEEKRNPLVHRGLFELVNIIAEREWKEFK